jgi:hypothetical protein
LQNENKYAPINLKRKQEWYAGENTFKYLFYLTGQVSTCPYIRFVGNDGINILSEVRNKTNGLCNVIMACRDRSRPVQ